MSDAQNKPLNLFDEQVTFIQHHLPGLDAGNYELSFSQSRQNADGVIGDTFSDAFAFAVKGDRFKITQPGDLYSVFPPADGSPGEYDTVLPHVVFTKKTFPWIRYPNKTKPVWNVPPGKDVTDMDVPTWLTVLLLDEDDVSATPGLSLPVVARTIADLFPKQLGNTGFSYFPTDNATLDFGEQLTDQINTIDIPLGLFWAIAPTLKDLEFLAHARKVSLLPKVTIAGISDIGEPLGDFSIVFGNRLPQDGKRTYAYLVSLEELEIFLPTDDGQQVSGNPGNTTDFLRLAVLKNWTFDSYGSPAAFDRTLLSLNGRDPDNDNLPAPLTTLQLPYAGSDPQIQASLQMGYTPINHELRTGEQTVSWYRGPLTPALVSNQRVTLPLSSADQAMFFDPSTGLFDLSYAAAWTLGRQLALQDEGFSTGLYKWKKGVDQQVIDQAESVVVAESFESILQQGSTNNPPPTTVSIQQQLRRNTLALLLKNREVK